MLPSIVELLHVSKVYENGKSVRALCDVSLQVRHGERVAITGPSGSGKSTLLHIVCGLDEPTSGVAKFQGLEMSRMSDDERTRLRREKIGMVFQTFNLMPTLSALENVALPLRLQGAARREAHERAAGMLSSVGMDHRAEHYLDELSGGERQRIAIARALVFHPPLLLADEPTGNLDSGTGGEILKLLAELHRCHNIAILLVTHNPVAAASCDRILMLRDGILTSVE